MKQQPRPRPHRAAPASAVAHAPVNPLDALVDMIAERVVERLEPLMSEKPCAQPEWLSRERIAQHLGISVTTLDRLVHDGMPYVWVGDSKRFRVALVDNWLEERMPNRSDSNPRRLGRKAGKVKE